MPRAAAPTVDVVVSTFNEEAYVDRCLQAVRDQDYPRDRVRIWVVDGGSSDATVERIRAHSAADERVTVIADGCRLNLPEALNVAVERSSGELVAKVDAHGHPEPDFLARAADALAAEGGRVACAGGRPVQEGETAFGRAVALARTSRVGVGASEYAGRSVRELVDTVQCGVYRRAPLLEVGSFDPAMAYGEDEEVNWRLRQAGYAIVLDTDIRFHYVTRPSWRAAYRQYRNYGEARVRVVRKHPQFLRVHHLVPAAAAVAGGATAVLATRSRTARRALLAGAGAYGAVVGVAGVSAAGGSPALGARVAGAIVALHAGYAVGMLRAAARWRA